MDVVLVANMKDRFEIKLARALGRLGAERVLALALVLASVCLGFHLFQVYWRLRHVRGPFWARFTNLQRVRWATTGRAHEFHQQAHFKYGEAVRFGPNMVSLANPEWIPTVYPVRPGFPKASAPASALVKSIMAETRSTGE
jgi:hypothetical protein